MDNYERDAKMWVDLLLGEAHIRQTYESVTVRAELYLGAGLPLDRVLDALKLTPEAWEARLADVHTAQANRRDKLASVELDDEPTLSELADTPAARDEAAAPEPIGRRGPR